MRRLLLFLASLAIPGYGTLAAHATPITAGTYVLSGATVASTGDTLTGTLTFNSSGFLTGGNLIFNDSDVNNPTFTVVGDTGISGSPTQDYAHIRGATGQVELFYSPTLNAAGGISLCISGISCQTWQGSYVQIYSSPYFNGNANLSAGAINPIGTAVTPEPSSLLLLGTGILGGIGAAAHNLFKAQPPRELLA